MTIVLTFSYICLKVYNILNIELIFVIRKFIYNINIYLSKINIPFLETFSLLKTSAYFKIHI